MKYNIETLTRNELLELIKNGDDTQNNQIRVTKTGIVFLSQTIGAEDISNLKFRFETFDAGNGYVGPLAAKDGEYIDELYNGLVATWKLNKTGYIDCWKMF